MGMGMSRLRLGLTSAGGGGGFRADFYVDGVNGDDANDGLTAETAVASLERLDEIVPGYGISANIGVAAGSRLAPITGFSAWPLRGWWSAYGEGRKPIIDCSLPVNAGDITQHATYPNVWEVEITHTVEPDFASANYGANGPHFALWWEDEYTGVVGDFIAPYFEASDIADGEMFVSNNPGRCFVHKVGSTTTDARSETSGTVFRYVFQLPDSGYPKHGGELRYANYWQTYFQLRSGGRASNFIFMRDTRGQLTGGDANNTDPAAPKPLYENCAWLDPGCHGVVGVCDVKKSIFYSRTAGSYSAGGGAWHNYTNTYDPRAPMIEDSHIEGFTHAVYSHGSGQSPVLAAMDGKRLTIRNCQRAISMTSQDRRGEFEDLDVRDTESLASGQVNIKRFKFQGSHLLYFNGNATLEDGAIRVDRITNFNITEAAGAGVRPIVLRRISNTISTDRINLQTAAQPTIPYTFEDCIVGVSVFVGAGYEPGDNVLESSTILNSYIGPTKIGGWSAFGDLASYQAIVPGVDDDTVRYVSNNPATYVDDIDDPTLTGPASILGQGKGVDPAVILALPATLNDVPTLSSLSLNGLDEPELGAEIINNGRFDTDVTGWGSGDGSPLLTWNSGAMDVEHSGSEFVETAAQFITLTPGSTYRVVVDLISLSGSFTKGKITISTSLSNHLSNSVLDETLETPGRYNFTFTAAVAGYSIHLGVTLANGNVSTYDNISIREVL